MPVKRKRVLTEICFIFLIISFMFLVLFSLFGRSGWFGFDRRRAEYQQIQSEISRLKLKISALKERVVKLEKDPATVEEEIRKRLLHAKSGERVYQVVEPEKHR